jgi:hypothetical protein
MRPDDRTVVDLSIWLLFAKAVCLVLVTVYTFARAYRAGATTPQRRHRRGGSLSCATND